jgi:hypothetical protein
VWRPRHVIASEAKQSPMLRIEISYEIGASKAKV